MTSKVSSPLIDDLLTLRDWLRYGTSRFREAGLAFGHGTESALDEAAYLILHVLHLPIDDINPWLDARLTPPERQRLAAMFEARIATRKPASYLTREAWIKGRRFYVDERAIVPRSYIGELLADELPDLLDDLGDVKRILDLGTGSGCLAILAAEAFPDAEIDAVDISKDALEVARRNVADYELERRIRLVEGDLFGPLGGGRYDLILANPPYVGAAAIQAFPPEYQAEPLLAHAGGRDGLDIVRRILAQADAHLEPSGFLIVEIGMGRLKLERDYPGLPFLWLETEKSSGEVFALHSRDLKR